MSKLVFCEPNQIRCKIVIIDLFYDTKTNVMTHLIVLESLAANRYESYPWKASFEAEPFCCKVAIGRFHTHRARRGFGLRSLNNEIQTTHVQSQLVLGFLK